MLVRPAPPHAFPSPYPPTCPYNPFPMNHDCLVFDRSEWIRLPSASTSPTPRTTADVDTLVELFSQLNVRDDSSQSRRSRCDTFAAILAITVRPPCAPHPALISQSTLIPRYMPKKLRTVPAPSTRLNVFSTPSPQSQHTTLIPESSVDKKKRNLSQLPRRTHILSETRCRVRPLMLDTLFYPRSSSFGSQSSADTESSGYSSAATTPEPLFDDVSTNFTPFLPRGLVGVN